jgi:hypothetical protein
METIKRIAIPTARLAAIALSVLIALAFASGPSSAGDAPVLVEIFYLPHRPAEAVVRDVEGVASRFKGVTVRKYSFEDPGSRKLLEKYGLRDHTPIAIFINGKNEFTVGGMSISLRNFPRGNSFVPMFEGGWTYGDNEGILSSALEER